MISSKGIVHKDMENLWDFEKGDMESIPGQQAEC